MKRRTILLGGVATVLGASGAWVSWPRKPALVEPMVTDPEGTSFVYADGWIVAVGK